MTKYTISAILNIVIDIRNIFISRLKTRRIRLLKKWGSAKRYGLKLYRSHTHSHLVSGVGDNKTRPKKPTRKGVIMKLLTKEIKLKLPALYSQENEKDPMVVCKFFDPAGSWTWYAIEGSPVDEDGFYDTDKEKVDFLFFGFVVGFEPEMGYFTLAQLETAKQGLTGLKALPIERDLYFTPCKLSEIKAKHGITG